MLLIFSMFFWYSGCVNLWKAADKKTLKLNPVGYVGAARQMIWFQKRRESGFGLEGRIKKPQGPLSDEHPFIKVVVMGRCLISHVMWQRQEQVHVMGMLNNRPLFHSSTRPYTELPPAYAHSSFLIQSEFFHHFHESSSNLYPARSPLDTILSSSTAKTSTLHETRDLINHPIML